MSLGCFPMAVCHWETVWVSLRWFAAPTPSCRFSVKEAWKEPYSLIQMLCISGSRTRIRARCEFSLIVYAGSHCIVKHSLCGAILLFNSKILISFGVTDDLHMSALSLYLSYVLNVFGTFTVRSTIFRGSLITTYCSVCICAGTTRLWICLQGPVLATV